MNGAHPLADRPDVVHLNVLPDTEQRRPEDLLATWFTLVDVATAVARAGAGVVVVQAAAKDDTLELDGVRYLFVRSRLPSPARKALGLWATPLSPSVFEAVRGLRPRVVHFHGLAFPRHVGALVHAVPEAAVLVQDHANRVARPGRRHLYRRGFRGVAGVVFTAAEEVEPYRAAGVIPGDVPVFAIPESSSRFTPGDQLAARAATGLHGDPCLLWIGHLNANKDPLTALEAVARVAGELPAVRLWCVFRDAPLLGEVEARVAGDPRLAGRVHLLGPRPREAVEGLLRAADFFVLASHSEGSSFSVMEGMACGTPPLVTDIPSLRALTGGGAVGALFPPGDASSLARSISQLARGDRARLRRETRGHFEEHLSFEVLGRKLVLAYDALAGGRG